MTKGSATGGAAARRYAWLSISAAVITIGLKLGAFALTGSVGLFSDAAESLVNLVAALAALWALTFAVRPPDEEHAFGHNKAEYFSSGLESALIIIAAAWIGVTAWERLMDPQPLQNVGLGLSVTLVAAAVNGGVALVLLRAWKRLRSITLRADAQHLLTDVWTSVGVVLGIVMVQLTGWLVLDPIIALVVAANIVRTGFRLLNDTAHGLLDTALPPRNSRGSPAFSPNTKTTISTSTPCERGWPGNGASSRCTCSCPAGGQCNRATTSRRRSRVISRMRSEETLPSSSM